MDSLVSRLYLTLNRTPLTQNLPYLNRRKIQNDPHGIEPELSNLAGAKKLRITSPDKRPSQALGFILVEQHSTNVILALLYHADCTQINNHDYG